MRRFVLAVCAALTSGCVGVAGILGAHVDAYPGKARPAEELAIVVSQWAMLHELDGKSYGNEVVGYPSEVRILPGAHRITIHCNFDGFTKYGRPEVAADLQAGHFYTLMCHRNGDAVRGEIRDHGGSDPRKSS